MTVNVMQSPGLLMVLAATARHGNDVSVRWAFRLSNAASHLHTYSADDLTALPSSDGFYQRGVDMTRLETFVDAAFAFAVTLLVVGGGDSIPANFDEMLLAMKQVPAFAASFLNIMLFWYAHHIWSRRFGLDDVGSIALSLLLVFVVLVFVYPLKAIFSGALVFFSNGLLDSYFLIDSHADLRAMFVIFGVGYAAMSIIIVLLNRHALARRVSLGLTELEIFDTRTEITHWIINVAVPVISIVLALTLPDRFIVAAGVFYSVFGIVLPWYGIRRAGQRKRYQSAT